MEAKARRLGEFDLMEEHGLENGRKHLAVLTFEMEPQSLVPPGHPFGLSE